MSGRAAKKLTEAVTVRLDEDDARALELLVREREARDNGRPASESLVIRDLIRAHVRRSCARGSSDPDEQA